jgi:phosphoribosyl 1,2-cyclic phosphodiesterase
MLAKKTKAPFYMTEMTAAALDWGDVAPRIETFSAGSRLAIGDLEIDSFTIPHDAVDPVGFCLRQNGFKLGLVTDLGYMPASIKHSIRGCDLLLLESNHDLEMLKVGPYPWSVKQRVMSRVGHLSNLAVGDFLASDFDRVARTIILAHLSGNNNHPEIARMFAEQALARAGAADTRVLVAAQDSPERGF